MTDIKFLNTFTNFFIQVFNSFKILIVITNFFFERDKTCPESLFHFSSFFVLLTDQTCKCVNKAVLLSVILLRFVCHEIFCKLNLASVGTNLQKYKNQA